MNNKEVWLPFACTIGMHKRELSVSSYGRRKVTNPKTGKVLKLDYGTNNNGYRKFGRFGDAHRLIAQSFIPADNLTSNDARKYSHVNHVDGVKSNNNVSNLEWCSCAENVQHAQDTGLSNKDLRTHTFVNRDGVIVQGLYSDLKANSRQLFDLGVRSVQSLKQGDRLTVKGWTYVGAVGPTNT